MKTALITGASFGIGEEFARQLARRQMNLVLVARSEDKLQQLAKELKGKHPIDIEVIPQDLIVPRAGRSVFERVKERGIQVDLLINNAGYGDYGPFAERDLENYLNMIQLNNTVLVELTHLFIGPMLERGHGGIVNVGSIAGYQPLPYLSVYAATKAFVLSFSEALWAENKDKGIAVLGLCPGPTESNFFTAAKFPESFAEKNGRLYPASEVVREALEALDKKRSTLVTGGLGNQFIVNLPRFFPRDTIATIVEKQFKS